MVDCTDCDEALTNGIKALFKNNESEKVFKLSQDFCNRPRDFAFGVFICKVLDKLPTKDERCMIQKIYGFLQHKLEQLELRERIEEHSEVEEMARNITVDEVFIPESDEDDEEMDITGKMIEETDDDEAEPGRPQEKEEEQKEKKEIETDADDTQLSTEDFYRFMVSSLGRDIQNFIN